MGSEMCIRDSWWGAWLSEVECKHVIAPDYRVHGGGDEAAKFDRSIPDEWEKL